MKRSLEALGISQGKAKIKSKENTIAKRKKKKKKEEEEEEEGGRNCIQPKGKSHFLLILLIDERQNLNRKYGHFLKTNCSSSCWTVTHKVYPIENILPSG